MAWRVFAAAAIGKSHIDAGTPCQDAFAQAIVGDILIAAVCDGAGSQPLSHVGADAVSRLVVNELAERASLGKLLPAPDLDKTRELIADVVAAVRAGLEKEAATAGVDVRSYSATLVGVVATGEGGYFFHIGDGQGVARPRVDTEASIVALPENGEYANETYFVSGEDWREHLHITPIGLPIRTVALMTDGAAPFVMAKGGIDFYRPFIDPVESYLSSASVSDGCAALASTLEDPRTYRITGDDKTLLIALWT